MKKVYFIKGLLMIGWVSLDTLQHLHDACLSP